MFTTSTYTIILSFIFKPGMASDVSTCTPFFKSLAEGGRIFETFVQPRADVVMSKYLGLVDMWWVEYLDLSYLVFFIGLSGTIFNYKNFLVTMLNIELMYLGILSSIAIASVFSYAISGQIYALFILILAAAESAIGLGLLVVSFKYRRTLNFNKVQRLRG